MTPTATRLQQRLQDRLSWFHNKWFFMWHHIGGNHPVEIDLFDGTHARYSGIRFSGTPHDIYWFAIAKGLRKEIIDQLNWVEISVRAYSKEVAIRSIDECASLLIGFAGTIRNEAIKKDRVLRGDGMNFPEPHDFGRWEGANRDDIYNQADALKQALFPEAPLVFREDHAKDAKVMPERSNRSYQVALSFAGEQRHYVEQVAAALVAKRVAVFYDRFEANTLWGKDGSEHFNKIYSKDAQFVVMFISFDYVAKPWTRLERRAALSEHMKEDAEYVLPVRFDDTEVPGLPDTIQYLSAERFTPHQLAIEIVKKLGILAPTSKASDLPPPTSTALSGEVTFDYSAHNGRFVIGSESASFETAWTKASNTSIHIYNDPLSINGVAIARGMQKIEEIKDASSYDFSSRTRTPQKGEVVVIRNTAGFYAAVNVIHIDDDSRGSPSDALTIRYVILADGSSDFSVGP